MLIIRARAYTPASPANDTFSTRTCSDGSPTRATHSARPRAARAVREARATGDRPAEPLRVLGSSHAYKGGQRAGAHDRAGESMAAFLPAALHAPARPG